MNKPDDLPLTPQTLARHFIGNAWVRSAKGLTLPVVDPANGQVFAYARDGKPLGRIDVPERPLQLIFGGADHRTLFILTHHALYAVDI